VIVGLGNEFADFTQDPRRLVLQSGNFVRGEAETRAWERWADRVDGIAPYIQTATVGVNPATNLTWALMAHRDPETLAWSAEPLIDPPQAEPLPISVPPWWGMRDKAAMFYTTIGRGDHSTFMLLASMLCVDSVAEFEAVDAYADDIRAYIASLEAPAYPHEIDAERAALGAAIYARGCATCHGGAGDRLPQPRRAAGRDRHRPGLCGRGHRRLPRPVLRLDRALPLWRCRKRRPGAGLHRAAARRDLGHGALPAQRVGAEPRRAAVAARTGRATGATRLPRAYDRDAVGWRFERLDAGQEAEADPDLRRRIYDTTRHGLRQWRAPYGARPVRRRIARR
jgi:hypothetical protein